MQTYLKTNEIFKMLLDLKYLEVPLKEVVEPDILLCIAAGVTAHLHRTNQEKVTEFNDTFLVERETTNDVSDFITKELRLQLIIEETVELAFALGFGELSLKYLIQDKIHKVYDKPSFTNKGEKLTETFDALIDLLYVTYGALDCFNLAELTEEGFTEVHNSNMSKICTNMEILSKTVSKYSEEGIELKSLPIRNNNFVVVDAKTNKVLKSIAYKVSNLKQILINHFKI